MKGFSTVILVAMAVGIVFVIEAFGSLLPTYIVQRTTGPIHIDGLLDEPDWKAAESVGDFVFPWWTEGEKEQTIAKLLWDDKHLYVAFRCEDAHIWAEYTQRDDPVSADDAVEVFTAPNPDSLKNYFNFEFNAIGTILDRSPYNNRSSEWNAVGIQTGYTHNGTLNQDSDTDTSWTMEIAIPFENFVPFAKNIPPKDGDVWRLNLNRCGGKIDLQYSQWSDSGTPKPQFHAPEGFGMVHFSEKTVGEATPAPSGTWGTAKANANASESR